ncbi:MAG TPA: PspC domain-containing protein [Aequorivita sp.]|nr:PspC domain-containing protein [Aequorivita sp.]
MNKTVSINLAGTFFHIDEDAFAKLSHYLDAIRKSLKGTQGSEEIMQDIETRIAELFSEKIKSNTQVISLRELDEVIAVMGQPEDYEVDEEMFEDSSESESHSQSRANASHKQLFRDIDNKYVGGVSSGLGHYLGIDAVWIRLIWVLLVVAGLGSPVLVYILLWILVPPALTTSEKLKMTGKPINISNIERKFREGFDNVADRVKNVDYDKYGNKIKTGASSFFDNLLEVAKTLLKAFAKLIGLIIIIVTLTTLISLVISLFTFGSMDIWGNYEMTEYITLMDSSNAPVWLIATLILFAVGIPFFLLFVLGLKLLISNLKSMGSTIKILLVVLWVLSIIGLLIIGIRQATETAYSGNFIEEKPLNIHRGDTLLLTMKADNQFGYDIGRSSKPEIKFQNENERVIYLKDIRVDVKSTFDSIGKIIIEKKAEGNNHLDAKKRAEAIEYNYSFQNNRLNLNSFFLTAPKNKYRDQKVKITIYMPEDAILSADENVRSFYALSSNFSEIRNAPSQYYRILRNQIECLDCSEKEVIKKQTDTINPTKTEGNWEAEVEADFNQK